MTNRCSVGWITYSTSPKSGPSSLGFIRGQSRICYQLIACERYEWRGYRIMLRFFLPLMFLASWSFAEELQYLEPLRPYDEYQALVQRNLVNSRLTVFSMVVRPSFSPEYSICITSNNRDSKRTGPIEYKVVYTLAQTKIWKWKNFPDGHGELDLHPVDVASQSAVLDAKVALKLFSVASDVLVQTRYPKPNKDFTTVRCDGTNYEFCCGNYWGNAWSPETGIPALMVRMGELLGDYAKAGEKGSTAVLKQLDVVCADLQKAKKND